MTNPHLIQQLLTPSDASSSKHSLHERITSSSIDDYSIKQATDKSQVMYPVLVSPDGFVDDRYLLYLKEDNNDLFNFFSYLLNLTRNETLEQITDYEESSPGFESAVVVALFQVFIIILVFFCVVFMYKCNSIMKVCGKYIIPEAKPLEEELYNDKRNFIDYLCLPFPSCYRLKKLMRRKRKNRDRHKR